MSKAAPYRYAVGVIQNDANAVQKHLDEWSAAGWELMSGSTSGIPYQTEYSITSPVAAWTQYTMFWRKPRTSSAAGDKTEE